MGSRLKWILLVLLVFVAGQPERAEGVLPKVRIGLLQHCERVSFSGREGVTVQSLRGSRVLVWPEPGERWEARASGDRVRILGADGREVGAFRHGVQLSPPEGGTVMIYGVAGHWDGVVDREYRGVMELRLVGGRLTVVNVLDTETYLRGVVPSEMPATYPLAALQAQAVAARGQALMKAGRHGSEGFDLCATQHCQVYGGATIEDARSDQAVVGTWGEVVVYEGRLADTLYSSTCGGHTANNEDYWVDQKPVPYLRGVADFEPEDRVPYAMPLEGEELGRYLKYAPRVNCNRPRYAKTDKIRWWSVVPREELEETLRGTVGEVGTLLEVRVSDRAESGLVRGLDIVGTEGLYRVRGGPAAKQALGGLNSAAFAVEAHVDENDLPVVFVIWGAGWGHNVGMCQVGAAGLADEGWDYQRILAKYYTGCRVVRRY